jgi:hypothetical protein
MLLKENKVVIIWFVFVKMNFVTFVVTNGCKFIIIVDKIKRIKDCKELMDKDNEIDNGHDNELNKEDREEIGIEFKKGI